MIKESTYDPYGTIKERPLVRGECPFCKTPYATTPKLALSIQHRGCLKCLKFKDTSVRTCVGLEKVSKGYEDKRSAYSARAQLTTNLIVRKDADGFWYVFKTRSFPGEIIIE